MEEKKEKSHTKYGDNEKIVRETDYHTFYIQRCYKTHAKALLIQSKREFIRASMV